MNRNPLIPFALIAVFGIGLMFVLGFVGLGNMDEMAEGGEKKQETAAATPEEIYQGKCASCHGADFGGGAGPKLAGNGLSPEEIAEVLKNGKGIMPPNIVPADKVEEMAKWVSELK